MLVNRKSGQVSPPSQSSIYFFLTPPNKALRSVYFSVRRNENTQRLLNQPWLFSPWLCMEVLFC